MWEWLCTYDSVDMHDGVYSPPAFPTRSPISKGMSGQGSNGQGKPKYEYAPPHSRPAPFLITRAPPTPPLLPIFLLTLPSPAPFPLLYSCTCVVVAGVCVFVCTLYFGRSEFLIATAPTARDSLSTSRALFVMSHPTT